MFDLSTSSPVFPQSVSSTLAGVGLVGSVFSDSFKAWNLEGSFRSDVLKGIGQPVLMKDTDVIKGYV